MFVYLKNVNEANIRVTLESFNNVNVRRLTKNTNVSYPR